jgi:hypothetical protein
MMNDEKRDFEWSNLTFPMIAQKGAKIVSESRQLFLPLELGLHFNCNNFAPIFGKRRQTSGLFEPIYFVGVAPLTPSLSLFFSLLYLS